MNDPLVSIVVPIYNQEKYLDKSIPSLLGQDYTNLEVVLVNDGSTDSSRSIMSKYESLDQRIRTVDKPNGGLVDATIAGVEAAMGDYIAFLDPDDYVGPDFIANFVKELDADYDFVAKGFYYDKNGSLSPLALSRTTVYGANEIHQLKGQYLYSKAEGKMASNIFFSRWNKLYKASILRRVINQFKAYTDVSLGEDTIFTYLLLGFATSGKAVQGVNSYYYNIGNQNSMMKSKKVLQHIQKAQRAFDVYASLLASDQQDMDMAYILLFHLVEPLFNTIQGNAEAFAELMRYCHRDRYYQTGMNIMRQYASSKRIKINLLLRSCIYIPSVYRYITTEFIAWVKKLRFFLKNARGFIQNSISQGPKKAMHLYKFSKQRENAFIDVQNKLPVLEERITDIVRSYTCDCAEESFRNNIFIFWWDGFDAAPKVVKKCRESVKRAYPEYQIIEISRENYENYTDIDSQIKRAFAAGKISIQTFSDILRFNLLKNNGGMWIDATIFFLNPCDLRGKIEAGQSFNSLAFGSSASFMEYKGTCCSWSGFFIASKKNGRFVRIMDHIFKEYFLTYHTYSTYFFIDAAFMICKQNQVDDCVLEKTLSCEGDMFLLSKIAGHRYHDSYMNEIKKVPQKLAWNMESRSYDPTSMYHHIMG